MKLLYSGAPAPDADSNADQSLGGFISDSPIPNGVLDNLFSEISKSAIQSNQVECKLIVLINDTDTTLTSFQIWTALVGTPVFTVQLAVVAPGYDAKCNRYYFEQIATPYQLPLQATFAVYDSSSPLDEDDLPPGGIIGIWIQRNFTTAAINANSLVNDGNCEEASIDALIAQEQNPTAITTNTFNLILNFDLTTTTTTSP